MKQPRSILLGKILEALGLGGTAIALFRGIEGDMWGELYLFISGVVFFLIGRQVEKQGKNKNEGAPVGN